MPWGAAVGAIAGGLIAANASDNASDTAAAGSAGAIGEQRRQFNTVRQDTAPYRDVGRAALYSLAGLSGLPGFENGPRKLNPEEQSELKYLSGLAKQPDQTVSVNVPGTIGEGDPQGLLGLYGQQTKTVPALTEAQKLRLEYLQGVQGLQSQPQAPQRSPTEILQSTPGYQFRLQQGQQALERNQSKYRFTPRAAKEMTRYSQGVASDEFGRYLESQFRLAGLGGNAVNTSASAGANAANQIGNASMSGAAIGANAQIAGAAGMNNAIQGGLSNYYTLQAYNQNRPQSTPFYGVGNSPY